MSWGEKLREKRYIGKNVTGRKVTGRNVSGRNGVPPPLFSIYDRIPFDG